MADVPLSSSFTIYTPGIGTLSYTVSSPLGSSAFAHFAAAIVNHYNETFDRFAKFYFHVNLFIYTKILEVNLFAFAYRLFHRDFSPTTGHIAWVLISFPAFPVKLEKE